MKLSRSVVILLLGLLLLWLFTQLPGAAAQGPIVPTPPPVATPITPQQIDALNDQADAYAMKTEAALQQSQAAINSAYAAIASAQAGLSAALETARYEHAARVAAEQGQIQQAVSSAQAALTAANTATALAKSSNDDAVNSMLAAQYARRDVDQLSADLRLAQASIDGLTKANREQQQRIAQLTTYSWNKYDESIIAWVTAGVLGFVLLAGASALIIIIALERRSRWPRFRQGIEGAIVMPIASEK
jgi:uncharacterized phage infection (PIP) family protein YhgE